MEGFIDAFAWLFMLLYTLVFYPLMIPFAIFLTFFVTTSPIWLFGIIVIILRKLRILKKDAFDEIYDSAEKYFYWYGFISAIALLFYMGFFQSLFMSYIELIAKYFD